MELVLDAVDQGLPGGVDDVLRDADRAPEAILVAGLDDDADPGRRTGLGVDHADLVVDQAHVPQGRVEPLQALAQGRVQGIDRAVAFADHVLDLVAHAQLDRGLGDDPARLRSSRRSRGT